MSEDASELAAELVVDGAVPSQPVVSPDGCWVAYVVAPVGRGAERCLCAIWLAAADGSSPPWKLTAGTAADSDPRWAPDSASVFFFSDRTGSRQLHRVRVGGGEAEVLTDWRGEIAEAWPLADARLVAVAATDEPTEEDKRRRAERDDAFVWGQQLRRGRLRVLDLATGELRTVDGLGSRHVVELAARPDGGALAVISWAGPEKDRGVTTSELHVVDLETGTARDLGRIGTEARSAVWWQADGCWHLAYLAMPEPYGGEAVYGFLDWHRSTLLWKCAGLTGEQLALASVPPSNLSLLGIVRHMADVERAWFRIRFRGQPLPRLYDNEDAAFEHADPARAEADFAAFAEECDLAREAVTGASLDDEFTTARGRTLSLRWVYTHMIEEYARHNGHADLLRQRIDGATGS